MNSFPVTRETRMKITVVNTPKSKGNGKWCPWMIDAPVEVVDTERK